MQSIQATSTWPRRMTAASSPSQPSRTGRSSQPTPTSARSSPRAAQHRHRWTASAPQPTPGRTTGQPAPGQPRRHDRRPSSRRSRDPRRGAPQDSATPDLTSRTKRTFRTLPERPTCSEANYGPSAALGVGLRERDGPSPALCHRCHRSAAETSGEHDSEISVAAVVALDEIDGGRVPGRGVVAGWEQPMGATRAAAATGPVELDQ